MTSPWRRCLDELAGCLHEQRTAVAQGRPEDVVPFSPPTDLGPVPPALARRAAELAAELDRWVDELGALTAASGRQLQLATVLAPAAEASSFLDARG